MSHPNEKLCEQCGMALGMPGPPKVTFTLPAVGSLCEEEKTVWLHDMHGVSVIEQSILCPACGTKQVWVTDCAKVREDVRALGKAGES